ncbi:hypothetical protein QOT17_011025 [Balamuthia mandrillaris]
MKRLTKKAAKGAAEAAVSSIESSPDVDFSAVVGEEMEVPELTSPTLEDKKKIKKSLSARRVTGLLSRSKKSGEDLNAESEKEDGFDEHEDVKSVDSPRPDHPDEPQTFDEDEEPVSTAEILDSGKLFRAKHPLEQLFPKEERPFEAATSLELYRTGRLYVSELRDVKVGPSGEAALADLPTTFQPPSLHFRSLTDSVASLQEYTYYNGGESLEAAIKLAHGKSVIVTLKDNSHHSVVKGTLIGGNPVDGVILLSDDSKEVVTIKSFESFRIEADAFPVKPVVHAVVNTQQPSSSHQSLISYAASSGVSWEAKYDIVLQEEQVQLSGWWVITNNTGKTFKDAAVTLVADEPEEHEKDEQDNKKNDIMNLFEKKKNKKKGGASGTHSYRLPHPVTLPSGLTKQVRIIDANFSVRLTNLYAGSPRKAYYPGQLVSKSQANLIPDGKFPKRVIPVIQLDNKADNNLGLHLPEGEANIFIRQTDGLFLRLLHSTKMEHSNPGESFNIPYGECPNLTAERKVLEFKNEPKKGFIRETIQISLKNRGKVEEKVVVEEVLFRWRSFKILFSAPTLKPKNINRESNTIRFPLIVRPGTTVMRYQVVYNEIPHYLQ